MKAQDSAILGAYRVVVESALAELRVERVVECLWAGDHTVCKPRRADNLRS